MKTALWWIRRDLRVSDNQALMATLTQTDQVVPVFLLEPAPPDVGDKPRAFLLASLRQLDADLRRRGGRLIVRQGDPERELDALLQQTGAQAIFAEEDFSPQAQRRDLELSDRLPLYLTGGQTVRPPGTILKADGDPYVVYTPFSRKWKGETSLPSDVVLPAPDRIPTPDHLDSQPIPQEPGLPESVPFEPGEAPAQRRLEDFIEEQIYDYGETRDRMDLAGTSRLSPYLRFGMLSARQAAVAALTAIELAPDPEARESAETWLNELIWREFYVHILYHFPHVQHGSFRAKLRNIPWQNDETAFAAWCGGQTGYPAVDAAMRQLVQTGWMHNRARMLVASFLVKDLLIDWRWGEGWFMQHLVDGDLASNNGGWQWTAGTGTDAAPYFRIFNPTLQAKKSDPQGAYIRRWLAELEGVPDQYIHEPWRMPEEVQKEAGCRIGQEYPAPIVDHAQARQRALATYKQASQEEADA